MKVVTELPADIRLVARLLLGRQAVTVKQQAGPGAWLAFASSPQMEYFPSSELEALLDPPDYAIFLETLDKADLTRQALIIVTVSDGTPYLVVLDVV